MVRANKINDPVSRKAKRPLAATPSEDSEPLIHVATNVDSNTHSSARVPATRSADSEHRYWCRDCSEHFLLDQMRYCYQCVYDCCVNCRPAHEGTHSNPQASDGAASQEFPMWYRPSAEIAASAPNYVPLSDGPMLSSVWGPETVSKPPPGPAVCSCPPEDEKVNLTGFYNVVTGEFHVGYCPLSRPQTKEG